MANSLYDRARKHFALGDIVWKASGGSTIKVIMARSSAYTPSLSADEFFSDIPGGGVGSDVGITFSGPNGIFAI